MKPLLIILISFLTTLTAFGQQPEYPDSGFTDSSEAKNITVNGLKEGKWVEYFDDTEYPMGTSGYILIIYKNGMKIGLERGYYLNGKLQWLSPYTGGLINGVYKGYYENGILMQVIPYTNGMENGSAKYYIESGELSVETPYSDGNKNGIEKWYDENGKLEKEVSYNNGEKGLIKEYYTNGKIKSESIDTAERIQKMLIGTWVDIANPMNIWTIKKDTIRNEKYCWVDYFVSLEDYLGDGVKGTYWFGINYVACGDSDITRRPDFDGISIDSVFMKFHDYNKEGSFTLKRKQ
jgi:antitoxin component YwqK of YwqJK toxin-antitoxin module